MSRVRVTEAYLLVEVKKLKERIECLSSSDEIQAILREILVILVLMLGGEREQ